jgi:6-phosphofructokinase 1
MVVEVMGRYAGWIALHAGIAGSADVILIPEIPFQINSICNKIMERERSGRNFSIVVCAEGATLRGGTLYTKGQKTAGAEVQLGGIADYVAKEITQNTGKETRSLVLGHLQRGGSPTTFDRLLGLRFGAAAIRCIANGELNKMVALNPPTVSTIPIEEAGSKIKVVPTDSDTMLTARSLGSSFGD